MSLTKSSSLQLSAVIQVRSERRLAMLSVFMGDKPFNDSLSLVENNWLGNVWVQSASVQLPYGEVEDCSKAHPGEVGQHEGSGQSGMFEKQPCGGGKGREQ